MTINEWIYNSVSWDRQRLDGSGPAAAVHLSMHTHVFSWWAEANGARCEGTAETLTDAKGMADLWLRVHDDPELGSSLNRQEDTAPRRASLTPPQARRISDQQ